jgi:hypothetical protein
MCKFCKDCVHFQEATWIENSTCALIKYKPDLVTGKENFMHCSLARSINSLGAEVKEDMYCGPEGNLYKKKPSL